MLRGDEHQRDAGLCRPEVQADHRRAEVLAARLGARPEVLPSLIAIWAYWLVHGGDLATARGLIDRLTGMVASSPSSLVRAGGGGLRRLAASSTRPSCRRPGPIWRTPWRVSAPAPPSRRSRPSGRCPTTPIAVSAIALACVSTLRGELASAERWELEALRRAEAIGFPRGPFSLAFVKTFAAWIRRFLGDDEACRRLGAEAVAIGQEHGYALWTTLGSAYAPPAAPAGRRDRAALEQTIAALRLMGQEAFSAAHLGYLAGCTPRPATCPGPRSSSPRPSRWCTKTGEELHLPELLRAAGSSYARCRRRTRRGGGRPARGGRGGDRAGRPGGPPPRRGRRSPACRRRPGPTTGAPMLAEARADLPPSLGHERHRRRRRPARRTDVARAPRRHPRAAAWPASPPPGS